MKMYKTYKNLLSDSLLEETDPTSKKWWEGYVKQSAPFLGVKMADIRTIVYQWYKEYIVGNLYLEQQVDLALALFEGKYTEEKLAGIIFLQEILLPSDAIQCSSELERFGELFIKNRIYDWNVCDWFCVKVLGPLIKREGNPCATSISEWKAAQNLWQARASLVAFVPIAENDEYYGLIESACHTVIRRKERFAKTAVGWILRDISKHDQQFVERVLSENIRHFSTESLKNATKNFTKEDKEFYLQMVKNA